MRFFAHALAACFLLLNINGFSQARQKEDTALVNKLIEESKNALQENFEMAVQKAEQAQAMAKRINFPVGEAYALKNIGLVNERQGRYVEALDYYEQSLKLFRSEKEKVGIANLLNNIGSVYAQKGDDAKALENCLESLKIAEETGDKMRIMSALINVGSIYHNKKDAKAIEYLTRALPICEEMGNKHAFGIIAANIGEIYADNGNTQQALDYYNKALSSDKNASSAAYAYNGIGKLYLQKGNHDMALNNHFKALTITEKLDEKLDKMRTLKGIANAYVSKGNYNSAINYFEKAKALGEELKANVELKDLYQDMSLAYAKVSDYANAFAYKAKYADIKDTLYNDETVKRLGKLQFDFDLYKKEGEINLLTKEKSLKEVELRRQREEKAGFAIGLVLIAIIAFVIYRNYRIKAKTNRILDKQKIEIENLLLNILPSEVAKELQQDGHATPRSYEKVSVLFSDFKGFSSIAEKMTPEELVKDLNDCFVAFDRIIEKHKLEKIKTIGDSYMCAGGIPTPDLSHPLRMVQAALEIQEYMKQYNEKRMQIGLEPMEMRIGIHVGPVVAGVVGKKKYAYDIWGNTVNIASRMESNGAPGMVNISAATYDLIKEKYICKHRGKIYAKNVGDVDMYFVQREITISENSLVSTPLEPSDDLVPTK